MTRETAELPHQSDRIFLTDGGTETWLMYKRGLDLPHFSAFHLLNDTSAIATIRDYYRAFLDVALRLGTPFIFDSLTYRASRDWGALLGYSTEAGLAASDTDISGCIGPKGDAYQTNDDLTAFGAEAYHSEQIETFREAGADIVTALTLNATDEAIGIAQAADVAGLPSVISFTLEKNRRLRNGETLQQAIEAVDAATGAAPAYYMINCAHPVDFGPALETGSWADRILGLRSNASMLDHGTLWQLGHPEEGDPEELAEQTAALRRAYPRMNVFGGFCGTDFVHVEKIGLAVLANA
jgi:S-methylmethionine-dependent homocysteine/selenocysteine methylase